jgi:hypothetical protein
MLRHLYPPPVRVGSVAHCGHVNRRRPLNEREACEGIHDGAGICPKCVEESNARRGPWRDEA